MEMSRRGAVPSRSLQPLGRPSLHGLRPGQSCPAGIVLGSSSLASGGVPGLEGAPGTAAQAGTRGSPPAPGLGVRKQNTHLSKEP